jgi:hypothetical protein
MPAVPATVCSVPAAQAPWGRHIDWLACSEKVSVAQAAQARSTLDDGGVVTYWPGAQSVHNGQAAAFWAMAKRPLAQGAQERLLVEVPAAVT